MAKDVKRLVIAPRREHSRKPEEVYDSIERLTRGPYLELFARQSRRGWDCVGDQASLFDGVPRARATDPPIWHVKSNTLWACTRVSDRDYGRWPSEWRGTSVHCHFRQW
jgi:hypothetical protein